jgi:hypothetical protein
MCLGASVPERNSPSASSMGRGEKTNWSGRDSEEPRPRMPPRFRNPANCSASFLPCFIATTPATLKGPRRDLQLSTMQSTELSKITAATRSRPTCSAGVTRPPRANHPGLFLRRLGPEGSSRSRLRRPDYDPSFPSGVAAAGGDSFRHSSPPATKSILPRNSRMSTPRRFFFQT